MSVSCIQNVGQFGNQLFPTVLATLTAIKHTLNVDHYQNKLVKFKKQPHYDTTYDTTITTNNPLNENNLKCNVALKRGYYQNGDLLNEYRDVIKEDVFDLPPIVKNTKDVVLHLRLDGFNHDGHNSHIIHPDWYLNILKNIQFDKLFIVMATKSGRIRKKQEPHKQTYLDCFARFNPEIISNDEYTDFNFIRSFDTIISSNSTFSWWAAFCSDASTIYLPPIWEGKNSKLCTIGKASIVHHTEYKYINIETMETVKITYN